MDPLAIQTTLRTISGAGQLGSPEIRPIKPLEVPGAPKGPSFEDTLTHYLTEVNDQVNAADQGMQDLATGKSEDLHGTLIAMQKADFQVKLLVETRNKVVSAYQEIMRMQA